VTEATPSRTFLFSIDLEDIRTFVPGGERYAERVPTNVARYLEFLARHRVRCTFFTVGDVASFTSVRLRPSDSLEHALQVMATHQIRHVAVVDDDDRVVGSITQTGIARTTQEPRRGLKRAPLLPIS